MQLFYDLHLHRQGIIMHIPFITMPSIMASSCFLGQYVSTLGSTTFLVDGYLLIIYLNKICNSGSFPFDAHMPSMHTGTKWWHVYSHSCLVFCGLGFLHDCGMIANLLHTAEVLVCIGCVCYIDVYTAWCTIAIMITLPHLC